MISAAVIVVLLAVAASLGSWLFSQWVGARQRSPVLVLTVGGTGLVLLLGAAALTIIAAPKWWEAFVPRAQPAMETSPSAISTQRVSESVPLLVSLIRTDWPATACVNAVDTGAGAGPWFIDNDCEGVVAVVLAWCEQSEAVCDAKARNPRDWQYEPAGIVMISATQRPSSLRLGDDGPLIAATYVLKAPTVPPRRIVFLACYVTAPEVHSMLVTPDANVPEAEQRRRLQSALSADDCYARVARWSQAGRDQGRPPDSLLRGGVGV